MGVVVVLNNKNNNRVLTRFRAFSQAACLVAAVMLAFAADGSTGKGAARPSITASKPAKGAKAPKPTTPAKPGPLIETPAQGTVVRPGSRVLVKIRPDPALKVSRVSLLMGTWEELISFVDEVPPYDFVIPVDPKWSGPMRIVCSVLSKRDKLLSSGELTINVVPLDLPVSIAATDPVHLVAGRGRSHPPQHINVRGTYADGSVRDVGRSDLGTTFQSSDPRVVAVDGEGFLTPGVAGSAVVTVKNGRLSEQVPVQVRETAGPGAIVAAP